jgi:F-type H+-transporting ATPase subunit c
MKEITIVMVVVLSTLGPAAVIGVVGYGAVSAVGRNPSASPRILMAMIMAFIFAEAVAVMSLLMVYLLFK